MKQIIANSKTVKCSINTFVLCALVYALPSHANVNIDYIDINSEINILSVQAENSIAQPDIHFPSVSIDHVSTEIATGLNFPNSSRALPIATYSISAESSTTNTLYNYFFDTNSDADQASNWQAQVGLFVVNSQTTLFSSANPLHNEQVVLSSEVNLGFRWGTVNFAEKSTIESYSVLVGYGVADAVEVNLGYSALDFDQRIHESAFYEGTWYAGFSAKF